MALVLTNKIDGIGYITLNDSEKMNAFSQPLVAELALALEEMQYDNGVRVVVLRGAGKTFSAGGDIKGMKVRVDCIREGKPQPSSVPRNMRNLNRLVILVRRIEKPVIAWMEGAAAGGGLSLAMACDFSLAEEGCKMVFAFSNISLSPDMGSSVTLTARVGAPKATELFMTGKRFTGREAADWGIITAAYPEEQLEAEVTKLVQKLAAGPALTYRYIKDTINRTMYAGLEEAMEKEVATQAQLVLTQDHGEAVTAFLEKRKPVFQGK